MWKEQQQLGRKESYALSAPKTKSPRKSCWASSCMWLIIQALSVCQYLLRGGGLGFAPPNTSTLRSRPAADAQAHQTHSEPLGERAQSPASRTPKGVSHTSWWQPKVPSHKRPLSIGILYIWCSSTPPNHSLRMFSLIRNPMNSYFHAHCKENMFNMFPLESEAIHACEKTILSSDKHHIHPMVVKLVIPSNIW